MNFFKLNWVIIIVTLTFLFAAYYAEKSKKLISGKIKVPPKTFYLILSVYGCVIAILNYIAVVYFGSWKQLLIATVVFLVIVAAIMYLIKSKNQKES